jgi:molybdenum cofactor biosynthesis enzyme
MFGAGMTLDDLIQLVSYKLSALNSARASALTIGDMNQVVALDAQISQTQLTLNQLRSIND